MWYWLTTRMNHYDFVDLIQGHTKSTNGDIVNGPFNYNP